MGTGIVPLSVAPSERSLVVLLMVSIDTASAASTVAGEKLSTRMPASRAVDFEVEVLDLADGEALEADRDGELHFDQAFVRRALESFGGRDVAVFDEAIEIEAHVLGESERPEVASEERPSRQTLIEKSVAGKMWTRVDMTKTSMKSNDNRHPWQARFAGVVCRRKTTGAAR